MSAAERENIAWSMMRAFETLARDQYTEHAPALLDAAKTSVLDRLGTLAPDDSALRSSPLGEPIEGLLAAARGDERSTLIVQALLLEQLGQVIYERVAENEIISSQGRELARDGAAAAAAIVGKAPGLIEAKIGTGDKAFDAFTETTGDVLARLDALGEAVDSLFGESFDLQFADVMGDLTGELLPVCTSELGMQRRQLMMYLTSCLMSAA
jgi:hypothetical protein